MFIQTDIANGLILLKCGIMNALAKIEENISPIELGQHIPFSLIVDCAEERGWIKDDIRSFDKNGWECDYWYYMITPNGIHVQIEGCLWRGLDTKLTIINETSENT